LRCLLTSADGSQRRDTKLWNEFGVTAAQTPWSSCDGVELPGRGEGRIGERPDDIDVADDSEERESDQVIEEVEDGRDDDRTEERHEIDPQRRSTRTRRVVHPYAFEPYAVGPRNGAAIRACAKRKGYPVRSTGRLPRAVLEAYRLAHL
jgi:hypothetical protein